MCSKKEIVNDEINVNEEITELIHKCNICYHEIGKHYYKFSVDEKYQNYTMECILCGVGEYSTTILPYDSSKNVSSFVNFYNILEILHFINFKIIF